MNREGKNERDQAVTEDGGRAATNNESGPHRAAESLPQLVRDLGHDLSALIGKELSLARAELREAASGARTAAGGLAAGGAVAVAGLVVLLFAGVYALSNVVVPWLAAAVVGGAALLIGLIMVNSAKKRIAPSAAIPERTLDAAKTDTHSIRSAAR